MVFSRLGTKTRALNPSRGSAPAVHMQPESAAGHGEVIYLVSMASYPNYGDELIARRWLQFLAKTRPGAEVWLDCRHPATASLLFAGDHPNLHTTDALFRVIDQADQEWEQRSITTLVSELGTPLLDLLLIQTHKATTMHLLGGGFVNSQWPSNAGLVEGMRAAASVSGARLIATGQGLIPACGETFEGFDHVSVRDLPSAELLGVDTGVDDAFLINAEPRKPMARPSEIVVCIQSDATAPDAFDSFVDTAHSILTRSELSHCRLSYVEAIPGSDSRGHAALTERGITFNRFYSFVDMWQGKVRMGPGQLWISTRFHHHLDAAYHGASGYALTDSGDYYGTKHGSLQTLGSGWALVQASETAPELASVVGGPQGFAEARRTKNAEALSLYPKV